MVDLFFTKKARKAFDLYKNKGLNKIFPLKVSEILLGQKVTKCSQAFLASFKD